MDNQEKYNDLRRRFPLFEYVGYHYAVEPEGLRMRFDFKMGEVEFHPESVVERRPFLDFGQPAAVMDRVVFDIGMAELVSYWKCACAPTVRVRCGELSDGDRAFWTKLYWNGLGEFFYTNGIAATADTFLTLTADDAEGVTAAEADGWRAADTEAYLVPVGGGKDSVVTLELLRRAGRQVRPLIMNPRGATLGCALVAGFSREEVLVIRRTIDPTLLRLNAEGFLNGHTPFSAMLACYTRLASVLTGVANVALSNESSANESTVAGSHVNHQYSKSLEFEDDFRRHACHEGGYRYFSLLRPLSELQIAMLFSRETRYHEVFRSCNAGSKEDVWCGRCAKCLFAYTILSPFIEPSRLDQLFGKAMLTDESLRPVMGQLAGEGPTKPFECVGTVAEVRQAVAMAIGRWYGGARPPLWREEHWTEAVQAVDLAQPGPQANLSDSEYQLLRQACTGKQH